MNVRAAVSGARGAAWLAATGALLTVAALTFGAAPLLVPAIAFVALGTLTPVWLRLAVRGGEVRRRLVTTSLVEGEVVEAVAEIRHGRVRLPGARLVDPLADGPTVIGRPRRAQDGTRVSEVPLAARIHRRGLHTLAPPSLVAADPFGLAREAREAPGGAQDVLVLPRTEPVRWPVGPRRRRGEGEGRSLGAPPEATDIDGLRPYREGTPASRIHWPALARGAGLMERRLIADGDLRPLVVLDSRGGDGPALDAAVRAAASLTLALARAGGCRLLLAGERRPMAIGRDLIAWPAAHARLALVEARGSGAPRLAPGTQAVALFLVCARAPEGAPLTLDGIGEATLVLPEARPTPGRLPTGLEVSGCRGYRLVRGPRAVERAAVAAGAGR